MANWEPEQPSRAPSRFHGPGIFVNVEFGVLFKDRPHTGSVNYTSRRMQERLNRQRREQDELLLQQRNHLQPVEQPLWSGPHPPTLTPGTGESEYRRHRQHQLEQQSSLGIRPREPHERGSSAPPYLTERTPMPISPVSPITTIHHTSSMPIEGYERPLPPLPSQFRLGDDSLPWSTEPWYRPDSPGVPAQTTSDIELENRRREDPQRVRDLEELHQAMMTVDSLPYDESESFLWESVGETPRGPRSLGWAVSSYDRLTATPISPPPLYVVSQWEASGDWRRRPRSSG